ncbi:MAG: hypothetical protein HUU34_03970 [Saprospiraceae bacterium]|nr:hypothetical protein [Saprospiraceae bacterium]
MPKLNGAKDGRPFNKGQSGNPNGRSRRFLKVIEKKVGSTALEPSCLKNSMIKLR